MPRKSKLEEHAENLIAFKVITSTTGSLSDRAKRRYEDEAVAANTRLKNRSSLPQNSNFFLKQTWSDNAYGWARNLTSAIKEFSDLYPSAGNELQRLIEKHREVRRTCLEFGTKEDDIPQETYIQAIQKICTGISDSEAQNVVHAVNQIETALNKQTKRSYSILLPE